MGLNYKNIITKDYLIHHYLNIKSPTTTIADHFKCSPETISSYLRKFDIPIRTKMERGKLQAEKMKGLNNSNFNSIKVNCVYCNKEIYRQPCQFKYTNNFFCSKECILLYRKIAFLGKNNPNYMHGLGNSPYSLEFTDKLKYDIRKRDNFTCQCCGLKEKDHLRGNKYINLIVHHIDYNKDNCHTFNLITTCNKCNTIANGNRDYWFAYYTYIIENYIKEK